MSTSRNRPGEARRRGATRDRGPTKVRPEISSLESHLGYWLRFVSNHVSHSFEAKVKALGVTVAEWVVMRTLFDEGGIKPSDISDRIGLTRGAVSRLIERLANKGLVSIQADASDRRAQTITLTATGRRLVPKLAALADQNDAETFDHLSAEQRAILLSLLESIVERRGLRCVPVD